MSEYIERGFALEIVKRTSGDYAAAFAEIGRLPAADVAPVVHGRWENTSEKYGYGVYSGRCSECGHASGVWYINMPYRFCPYCGVKMDGVQ